MGSFPCQILSDNIDIFGFLSTFRICLWTWEIRKFCKILTHPSGGTPCIGLVPTILAEVKEVIKPSLLAKFHADPLIFISLMTVFVKFRSSFYMGGSPSIDPVPIILRGAKDFK